MFTNQKKHFMAADQVNCKRCGAEDSQSHRMFHCPFLSSVRKDVPWQSVMELPELQWSRGFFRKPLAIQRWEDLVNSLPLPNFEELFDEHVHIFTDGSTNHGCTVPISAWAVSLADDRDMNAAIVDKGPVPGVQCNYRAEIFAVWVAIQRCAIASLYVDNQSVVQALKRLQRNGWQQSYWDKHPEQSLWKKLWHDWQYKNPRNGVFTMSIHIVMRREHVRIRKPGRSSTTILWTMLLKKPILDLDPRNTVQCICWPSESTNVLATMLNIFSSFRRVLWQSSPNHNPRTSSNSQCKQLSLNMTHVRPSVFSSLRQSCRLQASSCVRDFCMCFVVSFRESGCRFLLVSAWQNCICVLSKKLDG